MSETAARPAASLPPEPQSGTGALAHEPELPLPLSPQKAPARGRILRQYELVDRVRAYDPGVDEDLINKAYVFAMTRHGVQTRASGDPYFAHPVEVAGLLTEFRLDQATIIAGLLHDTVEDTSATLEEIEREFGPDVAELVDGVTKLSQLEIESERTKQAENLQKFVMAMAKDVRVLLVKLCDRLHNMRTLHFIAKPEKRQRIARETLEVYAPLARRIGIQRISAELEDIAFHELHPNAESAVQHRLSELRTDKGEAVSTVTQAITAALVKEGIEARVFGREKRPYSIWKKLERKSISFGALSDVYGFRIIVADIAECYRALGVTHAAWRCVPGRFKDYSSTPKANGYRAIHTAVVGPRKMRVEIQIRTEEMERIAEEGVAAHWRYKQESYGYHPEDAGPGADPLAGLRRLADMVEAAGDPDEWLELAKLEMFQDQIFCFTPKGDVIGLPRDATPLDFAYYVHTKVGDTCIGCRINGEERPLRSPLRNGDVVEIIRSNIRQPPPDWESLATTGRAKSAIRRLIRESEKGEFVKLGRDLAAHALHRLGFELDEVNLEDALERLRFSSIDKLFEAVGRGRLTGAELADAAFPGMAKKRVQGAARHMIEDGPARTFVRGRGLTAGVSLHFMPCCSPLPGDRIVGVQVKDRGVEVHTIDCEALAAQHADDDWIDLAWTEEAKSNGLAVARVVMMVENAPGVLARICQVVGESEGNITNVRLTKRSEDFCDLALDIEVADARHMTQIAASLRASPVVVSVDRVRG